MFVFRSGLRFSFRALEVPEPRVRKRPLSPTNRAFSSHFCARKSKKLPWNIFFLLMHVEFPCGLTPSQVHGCLSHPSTSCTHRLLGIMLYFGKSKIPRGKKKELLGGCHGCFHTMLQGTFQYHFVASVKKKYKVL